MNNKQKRYFRYKLHEEIKKMQIKKCDKREELEKKLNDISKKVLDDMFIFNSDYFRELKDF